jgi:hypothetical protein
MTIEKIAQKQFDSPSTILHFARKGTSDCYWFDCNTVRAFSDSVQGGRRVALDLNDLAATDWDVITTPSR